MTATSGDKKLVRSLHRIDDEEYMAAYEAQQAEEKAEKEARKAAKNGGGNELIGQVPLKDEDDKSSEGKDNK